MNENDLNELKNIFSYLVDSFSYEVERDKKAEKTEEITKALENDKRAIESLKDQIKNVIDQFVSNYKDFGEYENRILESINTYSEQFFTSNSHNALSEISDLKVGIDKAIENGIKIMETFLSLNPFTILNSEINITIKEDTPEIREYINSSYGISYVFLLNWNESQFMHNPFFASLYNGIRIPVSINGEDIIYENLDGYHMVSASIKRGKMECSFVRSREEKSFNFVFENAASAIVITFQNSGNAIGILDNEELLKHTDLKILSDALEKLFSEIMGLETKNKKLISLKLDDNELLDNMEFDKIFYRIIESDSIKSLVQALPETSENPDDLSKDFIRQRIHTIGKDQDYILSTLFG